MSRKAKAMSIQTKYVLGFFLACFAPLMVSILLLLHAADNHLENSAFEFVSAYATQILHSLDSSIDDFDSLTRSLFVDTENIEVLSHCEDLSVSEKVDYQVEVNRLMAKVSTLMKKAKGISYYSAGGELFSYGLSYDSTLDQSLLKEPWFQNMMGNEATICISPLHATAVKSSQSKNETVTLSRKLYNYQYHYIGMLLVDFDAEDLIDCSEDVSSSDVLHDMRTLIRNQAGELLLDTLGQGGREESSSSYVSCAGITDNMKLNVKVIIPKENLRLKSAGINLMAMLAGAISLLLAALISIPLSKSITKPLTSVQKQMKKAENGEYEIVPDDRTSLELGELIENYNRMIVKIRRLIHEVYLAEIEKKDAKLLSLQTQINPHMLYNTLETIRMKALIQKDYQVAEMVKALARMFRVMLNAENGHTIREEVSYTQDYMMLQGIRYPGMLFFEVDLPEEVLEAESLPMMLQPIVENAIKHGFCDRSKPLHIVLSGSVVQAEAIQLSISNDGKVMTAEELDSLRKRLSEGQRQKTEGTHIGLINIHERLLLRYGSEYGLSVESSSAKGTCIAIRMPKRSKGASSYEV